MPFEPIDLTSRPERPVIATAPPEAWLPSLLHLCSYPATIFDNVMLNLLKNPNITSSHLFRADVLFDSLNEQDDRGPAADNTAENNLHGGHGEETEKPLEMEAGGFERQRTVVRRLIPRNPHLDRPLLQTCHFYTSSLSQNPTYAQDGLQAEATQHLVIYIPHAKSAAEIPWYHPKVRALAFLYSGDETWTSVPSPNVSIHIALFPDSDSTIVAPRIYRTLHHLLGTIHKHGTGLLGGYTKRTHHDLIIPQAVYQDTYTRLKSTHAARLIGAWAETTNPTKHVFEDLGIAAFLIELWREMYPPGPDGQSTFPGFVDLGCGNGVLVDILLHEGWPGHGVDARARKSWVTFSPAVRARLAQAIIVPEPLRRGSAAVVDGEGEAAAATAAAPADEAAEFHDGVFGPPGVFVVSNHGDELTGWTPLLAALSRSPFLAIPCCSHDLGGARFRAPVVAGPRAPRPHGKQPSAYAALVAWVERLGTDLGYEVEREMLRIPSTRNAALLGRWPGGAKGAAVVAAASASAPAPRMSVQEVLAREGGGQGWVERAMRLRKGEARGH